MNRKLLIFPISVLAFLFLMLIPAIPVTLNWAKCSGLCPAIPSNAKLLPDGSYAYTVIGSFTYWLFHFGGLINAYGFYAIQISSGITTFGTILFVVTPLCVLAVAGFALVFQLGEERESTLARSRETISE